MSTSLPKRRKNDGSKSEEIFKERMAHTFLYKLTDTKSIKKTAGLKAFSSPVPADFIVLLGGGLTFAEVKSSSNKTSFSLDSFRPAQLSAMVKLKALGGNYTVFVHNIVTDKWYELTGSLVVDLIKQGNKSIKWGDMSRLEWK